MLTFTANFTNLLNQRAVTAYNADITSLAVGNQYAALNTPAGNRVHFREPMLHRRWQPPSMQQRSGRTVFRTN